MIHLRQQNPVLQHTRFLMGDFIWDSQFKDLAWLRPDGEEMNPEDWQRPWISSLALMLGGDAIRMIDEQGQRVVGDGLLMLLNAHHEALKFQVPSPGGTSWFLDLDTGSAAVERPDRRFSGEYEVGPRSLALFHQPLEEAAARLAATAPQRISRTDRGRRRRRAGVVVPLFSIRSRENWGVGDIGDIGRFAAWANTAGFSVVQLLPVNQVSHVDPSPYAATSAFALDPIYLSMNDCEDFRAAGGLQALPPAARREFERLASAPRVDWAAVRKLKDRAAELAFARFVAEEWKTKSGRARHLAAYMKDNRDWLDDFALFAVWHEEFAKSWMDWPRGPRDRDPAAIAKGREENRERILRIKWLQWQLDMQWRDARRQASAVGVDLMGDLPFMVGVDSADVWANRTLFRVDQHVGTPPDDVLPKARTGAFLCTIGTPFSGTTTPG